MNKTIFVCHRPYHILRCCDFISKYYKNDCYNVLFTFDVKLNRKKEFQRFAVNEVLYSFFDEVVELPRVVTPSVRALKEMYNICKSKRKEYEQFVEKHPDVNTIYFFADDELEVQLLVGLFKERIKKPVDCILVDEGMVTYSNSDHPFSWKRRVWMKMFSLVSGLKYFNCDVNYGSSNIYNKSMANNVERAIYFHPPIYPLEPLSEAVCKEIRDRIPSKNVPDYDNYYFIYADTYEKSFEEDLPVIKEVQDVLMKYGVNFYIKLHPQQNEELYMKYFGTGIMLEKGIPIELFFGKNAVIGGTISSSLFNAALQGVKTVDISFMFSDEIRGKWIQKPISEQYIWTGIPAVRNKMELEYLIKGFLNNKFKFRK